MREISPILRLSASTAYMGKALRVLYQSTKASPPNIMVKNSDGSSAEELANYSHNKISRFHTKSTLRYSALFSILVVVCAQLVVAEHLVCFSDLWSYEPRYPRNIADSL